MKSRMYLYPEFEITVQTGRAFQYTIKHLALSKKPLALKSSRSIDQEIKESNLSISPRRNNVTRFSCLTIARP